MAETMKAPRAMGRRRACVGEETIPTRSGGEHMEECVECGRAVRWDLVDHPFFGFSASCPNRVPSTGQETPK